MVKNNTISNLGEIRFLKKLETKLKPKRNDVVIGIGDDAAVVKNESSYSVITTDMLIEGTHFVLDCMSYYQVGRKSAVVNLSDIAAMGAEPQYLLVSIGVPKETPIKDIEQFYKGLKEETDKYDVDIIGGDTVHSPLWTISVTLIGKICKSKNNIPLRSNLKVGQHIYVTGTIGDSGCGMQLLFEQQLKKLKNRNWAKRLIMRHILPEPRVNFGRYLRESCDDLAMIDISDGLYNELNHLSKASNAGVDIELRRIPISNELVEYCKITKFNPVNMVLFGGEDYELLFATKHLFTDVEIDKLEKQFKHKVTRIGVVKKGSGVNIFDDNNHRIEIADLTFRHF